MLNRQKILIHLLKESGRPVSGTELTKWSFLLRHEMESAGGSAFYDFVPYKLGPFSFALYQELDKLHAQSYIAQHDDHTWKLGDVAAPPLPTRGVERDVGRVVRIFGKMTREALLNYVYERHPAYTVNSERQKLAQRPKTRPAVFTAGYEGISIDRFLNLLIKNGIEQLIDVRNNPVARRYGFHKSTMDRLTSKLGISYVHVPELGIQSGSRQNLDTMDDRKKLFARYEKTTLRNEREAIARVVKMVLDRPSVLVCMEAEPVCCHRSHLATVVAELTDLTVRHLGAD